MRGRYSCGKKIWQCRVWLAAVVERNRLEVSEWVPVAVALVCRRLRWLKTYPATML
jgi:hypothetical protein